MQVWVGAVGAVLTTLVTAAVGPRLARWASGAQVGLPGATLGTAAVAGYVVGERLGLDPALASFGAMAIGMAVLVGIDLRLHRLPDRITLSLSAIGLVLLAVAAATDGGDWSRYGRAVVGGLVLPAVYLVLFLAARSGLGGGDVKLAGVLGLHLGWLGWPTLVLGTVAGFVFGGLVALALVGLGRATMATRVPFGPSMVAGAVLAIAVGNDVGATLLGG